MNTKLTITIPAALARLLDYRPHEATIGQRLASVLSRFDAVFASAGADLLQGISDIDFLKICDAYRSSDKVPGWLGTWVKTRTKAGGKSDLLQRLGVMSDVDLLLVEEAAERALSVGKKVKTGAFEAPPARPAEAPFRYVPTAAEIRAERLRQGLTQSQAAAKIGVVGASAYRTWQNYETEPGLLESGERNNSRDMPHERWTMFVSAGSEK